MIKKVVFIGIVIGVLVVFYNLSKQIYESIKVGGRLEGEVLELAKLQQKNTFLKEKLSQVQQLGYIESQARDKLNMSRPGETVVIIPQAEIDKVLGLQIQQKVENLANWQAWLKLFFK